MDPLPQPGEPEIVPVPIFFERAFSNRPSTVTSAGSGPGRNVPASTSETFMREVLEADLHILGARVGCEWRGRGYLEWGQRFEVSAVPFDVQNRPSVQYVNVSAVFFFRDAEECPTSLFSAFGMRSFNDRPSSSHPSLLIPIREFSRLAPNDGEGVKFDETGLTTSTALIPTLAGRRLYNSGERLPKVSGGGKGKKGKRREFTGFFLLAVMAFQCLAGDRRMYGFVPP